MKCRLCKSTDIYEFLDLGFHPPSDQFRKKNFIDNDVVYYPLRVQVCKNCSFFQLTHTVDPTILYQDDYPYESSMTITGKKHYFDFAKNVVDEFKIKNDSLVVDIGSNVGVLLEGFKVLEMNVVGVDPAPNIADIANKRGIFTINDFFNTKVVNQIKSNHGYAKVITGTNVFAHIDDLDTFLGNISKLLDPESGIFIIEAPYIVNLFKNLEYDTIYHEHLSYISIKPLVNFFEKYGLEIINVEEKDIHGGSIRIFVAVKAKYKQQKSVNTFISNENKLKIDSTEYLSDFANKVKKNKFDLLNLIIDLKNKGKKIAAVSAPAKGMTLLNYCHINKDLIDFVTEKSTLKINRYTPGGQIPVLSDKALIEHNIDYALLLAWNFADEIINNNNEYKKNGGKFIVPIPTPIII